MALPKGRRPFLRRGPSGPLAESQGGIVQIGYDQPTDALVVPPALGAFFPRNFAGDPLRVILPQVTPGNTLEVDWRANLEAGIDVAYSTDFLWEAIAVVSFNGVAPVVPSALSFFVVNSWGSSQFVNPTAQIPDVQSITGLAAIPIPDGATDAIIQLLYISPGAVIVGGTLNKQDITGLSATLKATEISENVVSQAGPGLISPTT